MLAKMDRNTHLLYGEPAARRDRNLPYMMSLKSEPLLLSLYFEAGLMSFTRLLQDLFPRSVFFIEIFITRKPCLPPTKNGSGEAGRILSAL